MKKVTITAYTYKELSPEAKEAVKTWLLQDSDRACTFRDIILTDIADYYEPIEANVQFSLSASQGDGVNIYGKFDINSLDKAFAMAYEFPGVWHPTYTLKEWRTLSHYSEQCGFVEIPYNTRYCFPMSSSISTGDDWIATLEEKGYRNINKTLLKRFQRDLRSWHITLCQYYIAFGYDYLYNIDDDEAAEICDANNYYFRADGTFFPEA